MGSEHITESPGSKKRTELQWRSICAEWEQSKESQQIFCKKRGLSYNRFVFWRSKILQEKGLSRRNKFAQIKCVTQTAVKSYQLGELKIHLPSGVTLSLSSGVAPTLLQTALKTLSETPY